MLARPHSCDTYWSTKDYKGHPAAVFCWSSSKVSYGQHETVQWWERLLSLWRQLELVSCTEFGPILWTWYKGHTSLWLSPVRGFHFQQLSCGVELKFCEMHPQNHNSWGYFKHYFNIDLIFFFHFDRSMESKVLLCFCFLNHLTLWRVLLLTGCTLYALELQNLW